MGRKIFLADIPCECRTVKYIQNKYQVSRVSAWRLISGKADHICPGYHIKEINISSAGWTAIDNDLISYMRQIVVAQLKKWHISPGRYVDDICQECIINAYQKSGVWCDMPDQKKRAYIATLCKRTANDFLKKETNYTDSFKNPDISAEKEIYPDVPD